MTTTAPSLRSKLSREILRILALEVAAPIAIAELSELLRVSVAASRSLGCFIRAINGTPCFLYIYLYRLSDRGLVKIEGRRRKKQVLLTPKGRRFLKKLQSQGEKAGCQPPALHEDELGERVEPLPEELATQKVLSEKRRKWYKRSRKGPAPVFLSYDIPERWSERRDWLREHLESLGFERFHESFYIGPPDLLRRIVEEAETWGLLPYLCWGKLQVMPG